MPGRSGSSRMRSARGWAEVIGVCSPGAEVERSLPGGRDLNRSGGGWISPSDEGVDRGAGGKPAEVDFVLVSSPRSQRHSRKESHMNVPRAKTPSSSLDLILVLGVVVLGAGCASVDPGPFTQFASSLQSL